MAKTESKYPMDGLAFFVLIFVGYSIFVDFTSGRPLVEYFAGMAIGWSLVHIYYWYQRRKKANYPEDWSEIRNYILNRDNYTCSNCNGTKELHVHHIVPLTRGGTNNETNLATLCEKCHIMIHPHMR